MFKRIRVKSLSVFLAILMVVSLLPVNVSAVELNFNETPIKSISTDKKLYSPGETATISIEMKEDYALSFIVLHKPITVGGIYLNKFDLVDGVYIIKFDITEQTESGIWKLDALRYTKTGAPADYIFNSNTTTGYDYKLTDFSFFDFEVLGTNADVNPPELKSYKVDKNIVSADENITFTFEIEDESLVSNPDSIYNNTIIFYSPSGLEETVSLSRVDDSFTFKGVMKIDSSTELGVWRVYRVVLTDENTNQAYISNSVFYPYPGNTRDFSTLDFEVVPFADNPNNYDNGDVNLDGRLTIHDVTYMQRYIAELDLLNKTQLYLADFDGNSVVNVADVTAIQRWLAGM